MAEARMPPSPGVETLIDLIRLRAGSRPDAAAFRFLADGTRSAVMTYGELDRRARSIAVALQDRGVRGEPVLVLAGPGLDFVTAFAGCVFAGAVAVPAPPLEASRAKRTLPRLQSIVRDARPALLLGTSAFEPALARAGVDAAGLADLPRLLVDRLTEEAADTWSPPPVGPGSLAYLQYTSGSTSAPKGVMVTHACLLSNAAYLNRISETYTPETVTVSWMPHYHDYGLVEGIVEPLFNGTPSVLLSPTSFLRRPLRWLQAITRYRGTHSGGPTFAYDYCLRRIRPDQTAGLDLSSWIAAHVGAEPVREEVLDRFADAFGEAGFRRGAFYPSYGLAEATLLVSSKTRSGPHRALRIRREALRRDRVVLGDEAGGRLHTVSCGRVVEPMEVAVVDPESGRRCDPDRVGEIWVRGPSVAAGYWRRPEESEATFGARLRESGDGPFLRTGDRGFLRDGELYVTGRLKELIIVAGVNHHPPDVEHTVAGVDPAVRAGGCAAFAVDSDGAEELVVAVEVERSVQDLGRLAEAIRAAIAEEHELDPAAVVLVKSGSLIRTSSGKLRRHAVRDDYLAGVLQELHRSVGPARDGRARVLSGGVTAPAAVEIEAWLLERLADRLELPVESLDPESEFLRFGLVSRDAVALVSELEERLGRRLSPAVLWSYPTVRALAEHLAAHRSDPGPPEAREEPGGGGAGTPEPIAIVGMACRLPGAANPEELWDLLLNGGDAVSEVPADRWDVGAFYDPDPAAPGKMTTRWGGFLSGLDRFDAAFFGISPREAAQLDPRQRLMLELAWEALEDAGVPPGELAGSRTGVYAATQSGDYGTIVSRDFPELVDAYSGPGNASSVVANRISYALDLRGPSLAVDTACSGSLVAVHLAAQELRAGEIDLALAGGVNVLLEPSLNVFFSKAGALARDGRCKSFDDRADGIVRSEGAGVLLLKRLRDALRDGDRVRAVVLGSAVNQDGRSNGIMAPNGEAQRSVLRRAYGSAGISPGAVQYVEAHGTGTPLGDSIEADAVGSVLGEGRAADRRLVLGSLKTNIGHAEAAAGVGGIVKTVLAMENRLLPATLHFREPSALIPFDELSLEVRREAGPWPDDAAPLIAGVSGFGIGGTNAHVVLGEAPPAAPSAGSHARDSWLVPLSARCPAALRELARALSRRLEGTVPSAVPDLCHTLAFRRSHHPHRLAVVAASPAEVREALAGWLAAAGEEDGAACAPRSPGRVAFVFSGQGSHWPGMGLRLLRSEEAFAAAFERCAEFLGELTGLSLAEELSAPPERSRLDRADVAQPAIFTVQVALAALLRSWGVRPDAVVGQSLGEAAAAHVAGALTLEDALRVVVARSRLMQRTVGSGRTAVVRLPYEQARLAVAAGGGRVSVAGSNSPEESVVSGEPGAVEALLASLAREGLAGRPIDGVGIAFHGPQMEPLRDELVAEIQDVRPREGELALYTALEGGRVAGGSLGPGYWGRNLAEPFRFGAAVEGMLDDGFATFVEIAPHPVLSSSVRKVLRARGASGEAVPTLRRDRGTRADALAAVGALYALGHDPDWKALAPVAGRFVGFPRYPWQRERHWIADRGRGGAAGRAAAEGRLQGGHPLLGLHLEMSAGDQHVWQNDLAADSLHFLDQTRVAGRPVVSEAVLLEMARAAADQAFGGGSPSLRSVCFGRPLVLAAEAARRVQVLIGPARPGRASLRISSRPAGPERSGWIVHATAELVLDGRDGSGPAPAPSEPLEAIRNRCSRRSPGSAVYRELQDRGRQYGPAFQVVDQLWEGDGELLARLSLPPEIAPEAASYDLHPALVDAGFQLLFRRCSATEDPAAGLATPFATAIAAVSRNGGSTGSGLWCHLSPGGEAGDGSPPARIRWLDDQARPLLELDRLIARSTAERLDALSEDPSGWFHELTWEPSPPPPDDAHGAAGREPLGGWLLFTGGDGCGGRLRDLLEASGATCFGVEPGEAFELDAGRGTARIDPRDASHYRRLLDHLEEAGFPSALGVVHLWSLEDDGAAGRSGDLQRALDLGARSLVHLAQALVRRSGRSDRLWVVTRGAQPVGAPETAIPVPAVAHSVLWGLVRGIGQQEHPRIWGGIVDLDPEDRNDDARRVLGELLGGPGEDQVAFRGGGRLAPRLRRSSEIPPGPAVSIWPSAAYLVTGGLGDLGLQAARHLVDRGARRLLLSSRSGLPPREAWAGLGAGAPEAARVAAVRELEAAGAVIETVALDVADASAVRAYVSGRRARSEAPIRGVVHCAGVLRDRLFAAMEPDDLEAVLRPKVLGAWNLAEAFPPGELDFLVLYSSVASFLVGPGQSAYAGANAFLDSLAHRLRSGGVPAVSVNWGLWEGTGMASARGLAGQLARIGARHLPAGLGLEIFDGALASSRPQLGVFRGDWSLFCRSFYPGGAAPRMLAHLVEARGASDAPVDGAAAGRLLQSLLEIPEAGERERRLLDHLRRVAASVLRLEVDGVDPRIPLRDLGIDSIMAVELKNQIEGSLDVSVSMSEWLSGPSVAHLATLLAPRLGEPERVVSA